MNRKSALTAVSLSVLFLAIYGTCNWITSRRSDVGTLYFGWELAIPLIPWLIIPYMSIDLFFVGAPFLCTEEERRIFSCRVVAAILVSGCCFLAMPLKLAYPQPLVGGWMGAVFQFLHSFDQPYNLFPSLHIALRTLLADVYTQRSSGLLKWALHVWFSLIGFSVVFTHQHHVLDVVGGFVLATLCFYFFRRPELRHAATKNRRIGCYYGFGALILLVLAWGTWPWGALLLWPMGSLVLVGVGYFGLGGRVYRKEDGKIPLCSKLLLGPCLLGQYLSLLYYKRQCREWDEIVPGVCLGRVLRGREAERATAQGVAAVLDVTAEFSENRPFLRVPYLNVPVLDLTAPTRKQLEEGVAFIARELSRGRVLVHCKIGYSRSGAFVAAFLLKSGRARNVEEAIELVRRRRPSLVVRPEIWAVLREYARGLKAA